MINYWKHPGTPHKGWTLITVIDVRDDGQPENETDYESCMMCGKDKIRYVHILEHPEINEEFRVGCNCAERMTDDYINPKRREQDLRNRASRRTNWVNKGWRMSQNGNYFMNFEGQHILIYIDKKTFKFKVKIDKRFGGKLFDNFHQARMAAFDGVEYLKGKGQW